MGSSKNDEQRGARCAIATGHAEVTKVAEDILRAGGNAYDAAVAAGFASSVCEPTLTSLGGGGFLMHRFVIAGVPQKPRLLDFFSDTPGLGRSKKVTSDEQDFRAIDVKFTGAVQTFYVGLGSVAVPGVLLGLHEIAKRYGTMPLHELVAPAISLCERGVKLTKMQRDFIALLDPILKLTPSSRALYDPLPSTGECLDQSALKSFLKDIKHGAIESFYKGAIARTISEDMAKGGGLLTREDLAHYQVIERDPLEVLYQDHHVYLNPPPSGGGLRLLAFFKSAQTQKKFSPTDDDFYERLVSLFKDVESRSYQQESSPTSSRGTTHLSISDDKGNVCAMTTSNGEGSAYVPKGTGIMLNNMLGEEDLYPEGLPIHTGAALVPAQRVSSMMCPTLLLNAEQNLFAALGSGGSARIRSAIAQVVVRLLNEQNLDDAIDAARVHFDGTKVQGEPGVSSANTNIWPQKSMYFGGVHAVCANDAAGDKRRGGNALVFER